MINRTPRLRRGGFWALGLGTHKPASANPSSYFKAIKESLGAFLESWDHALCLNTADPNFGFYQKTYGSRIIPFEKTDPTSERMAKAIFDEVRARLAEASAAKGARYPVASGVRVERVRVTETSSTWAEYAE